MATTAKSPDANHGGQSGGDHSGGQGGQTGRGGAPTGGMPMGGGMGGGHGGGGDQTRGGSKWRTQGQLFDEDDPAATFNGIVGEDPANRVSRTPKRS